MSVVNNTLLHPDDDISEAAKIAENACAVIEGKSQVVENSSIRDAFALPNICMWDKLLNQSVVKLQTCDYIYYMLLEQVSGGITPEELGVALSHTENLDNLLD